MILGKPRDAKYNTNTVSCTKKHVQIKEYPSGIPLCTKTCADQRKEFFIMGLIKAGMSALRGTLADQWKEFFYCDAMDKEVLVTKGKKRINSRSSNKKGNDNIISNGSVIAVADGQCMIIVEQGKVVEVCAEPGEFQYDTSSERWESISLKTMPLLGIYPMDFPS